MADAKNAPKPDGNPTAEAAALGAGSVLVVDHATAVQREQAAINADLAANPRDVTIPGGRFLKGGVLVNAYGHEIDEDGKLKNPEDRFSETI